MRKFIFFCFVCFLALLYYKGILHKERKAVGLTLAKTQELLDEVKETVKVTRKTVREVKRDYDVKSKGLVPLVESLRSLCVTLKYAVIVIVVLVAPLIILHLKGLLG